MGLLSAYTGAAPQAQETPFPATQDAGIEALARRVAAMRGAAPPLSAPSSARAARMRIDEPDIGADDAIGPDAPPATAPPSASPATDPPARLPAGSRGEAVFRSVMQRYARALAPSASGALAGGQAPARASAEDAARERSAADHWVGRGKHRGEVARLFKARTGHDY